MRIKRTKNEIRQFGLPTIEERVIALEELIVKLKGSLPPPQRKTFEDMQGLMDDIDTKQPKQEKG